MTAVMSSRVRVPVGSLIAIGPPASGRSTTLTDGLVRAGLPASRVVNRDGLRRKFGNTCSQLMCRAIPTRCTHHDDEVASLVEAHAGTFLAAGQAWLYDAPTSQMLEVLEHVERAHRAGLAAVALRRTGESGAEFLTLDQCAKRNAGREIRASDASLEAGHAFYEELSTSVLYRLGFDVVIDWDESTEFELMPDGVDARGIPTSQVVVVGDLHGCASTFFDRLLPALGTDAALSNDNVLLVSVGDIHDKGGDPQGSVRLIRWWLNAVRSGRALMVDSNHNRTLVRHLTGHTTRVSPGLADTMSAIEAQADAEALKEQIVATFSRLPSHLRFDDLVVVHAAITEDRLGSTSPRDRGFMLYTNRDRTPWDWTGSETLVHGHEPVDEVSRRRASLDPDRPGHVPGEVINVDTGAYAGGSMSAYLHDRNTTVAVETVEDDVAPCSVMHDVHVEQLIAV